VMLVCCMICMYRLKIRSFIHSNQKVNPFIPLNDSIERFISVRRTVSFPVPSLLLHFSQVSPTTRRSA
jgi:hypothetical protein